MMQEILIYVLLAGALVYLGFKYIRPKKKKDAQGKDCDNCG